MHIIIHISPDILTEWLVCKCEHKKAWTAGNLSLNCFTLLHTTLSIISVAIWSMVSISASHDLPIESVLQLGPCKDLDTSFQECEINEDHVWPWRLRLHTCQNMKCSLMMVFTASLLQTSLFRHWQAKSWTFCMLIISHLFSSCPQSFAWKHNRGI